MKLALYICSRCEAEERRAPEAGGPLDWLFIQLDKREVHLCRACHAQFRDWLAPARVQG